MSGPTSFAYGHIVQMVPSRQTRSYSYQLYEIVKRNPKTVGLRGLDDGRMMRCSPMLLMDANPKEAAVAKIVAKNKPAAPRLSIGTVVEWEKDGEWYVVLADKGEVIRMALLGGDNDRYRYNIPRSDVTVVDILSYFEEE